MNGWQPRGCRAAIVMLLTLGFLLAASAPLTARELAFYVGGGFARNSISGELDRFDTFVSVNDPVNGSVVFGADVEDGGGLAFNFGFALNRYLAFEMLQSGTSHDAESAGLPGEPLDANISGLLIGARGMLPLGDALEIFGRFGLAAVAMEIENNTTLPPTNLRLDSTFSGAGFGWGFGVAYVLRRFGIELGFNRHQVEFEDVDLEFIDDTIIIPDQDMILDTINLVFTFHFGRKLK